MTKELWLHSSGIEGDEDLFNFANSFSFFVDSLANNPNLRGIVRLDTPENVRLVQHGDILYTGANVECAIGNRVSSFIVWIPVMYSNGTIISGIPYIGGGSSFSNQLNFVYSNALSFAVKNNYKPNPEGNLAKLSIATSRWCVLLHKIIVTDNWEEIGEQDEVYCSGDRLPGILLRVLSDSDITGYLQKQAEFLSKLESLDEKREEDRAIIAEFTVYCTESGTCYEQKLVRKRREIGIMSRINAYLKSLSNTGKWVVKDTGLEVKEIILRFRNWLRGKTKPVEFVKNEYLKLYLYAERKNPIKWYAGATHGYENNVAAVPKNILKKIATQYSLDEERLSMKLVVGGNAYEFLIGRHRPSALPITENNEVYAFIDMLVEYLEQLLKEFGPKTVAGFVKTFWNYLSSDKIRSCIWKYAACNAWKEFVQKHVSELPPEIGGDVINWSTAIGFCEKDVPNSFSSCFERPVNFPDISGEPQVIVEYNGYIIPAQLIIAYLSKRKDVLKTVLETVCAAFVSSFSFEVSLWTVTKAIYSAVGLDYISGDYLKLLQQIPRWFEEIPDVSCDWAMVIKSFKQLVTNLEERIRAYAGITEELFVTSASESTYPTGVEQELRKVEQRKNYLRKTRRLF